VVIALPVSFKGRQMATEANRRSRATLSLYPLTLTPLKPIFTRSGEGHLSLVLLESTRQPVGCTFTPGDKSKILAKLI
jgi:hypothetical protein